MHLPTMLFFEDSWKICVNLRNLARFILDMIRIIGCFGNFASFDFFQGATLTHAAPNPRCVVVKGKYLLDWEETGPSIRLQITAAQKVTLLMDLPKKLVNKENSGHTLQTEDLHKTFQKITEKIDLLDKKSFLVTQFIALLRNMYYRRCTACGLGCSKYF